MTASVTGVGLGTGFGVASAVSAMTWQPVQGVMAEEYGWYVRNLWLANNNTDEVKRYFAWNKLILKLAGERYVPLEVKFFLLENWLRDR
jgi:hypothetical protein